MKNMVFHPGQLYHVYNRGNNQQLIFFTRDNYLFFLEKVRKYLLPHSEILAYSLMPNHILFLLETRADLKLNGLNLSIGTLPSSYTQAISIRQNRAGSLFQQHANARCLEISDEHYPLTCFHYIHQNPYVTRLTERMEDWEFSSFKDYLGLRNGTLCNQPRARQLLDLPTDREAFYRQAYQTIPSGRVRKIVW
ncbi:MAG: transposase [Cytophagaceae bacterium]|nr:transposase [Cytophagaceae bacterium]